VLEDLTRGLWIAWQPIYNLRSGTVWGHEALIRGPLGSFFDTPESLFELARREGAAEPFEAECRRLAFQSAAARLGRPGTLFVNIDPRFPGLPLPKDVGWRAERTVLEITEQSPVFDEPEVLEALAAGWRAAGYRIALDDFGAGFAGQAALLALRPDIVKVDRRLIAGIDHDAWKQTIVSAMLHMCSDLGIASIAEGIETQGELSQVVDLGVVLGQGYLLGPPQELPVRRPLRAERRRPERAGPALAVVRGGAEAARFAVDRGRQIVAWNETAAAITGRPREAMLGVSCWLSGLDHRDAAGNRLCFEECPLMRAMQTGLGQDRVVSLRRLDGQRAWMAAHVEPVLGADGRVEGAVQTFAPAAPPAVGTYERRWHMSVSRRGALANRLYWREELARWLASWHGGEDFSDIARGFVRSLPFRAAEVWQILGDGGAPRLVARKGERRDAGARRVAGGRDLVAQACRSREVVYGPSAEAPGGGAAMPSSAAVPLVHRGRVAGVLLVVAGRDGLPSAAIESMEDVAPLLAMLCANEELVHSLRQRDAVLRWMLETAPLALGYRPRLDRGAATAERREFQRFRRGWADLVGIEGGVLVERDAGAWRVTDAWGGCASQSFVRDVWWPRAQPFLEEACDGLPGSGWLAEGHPLAGPGGHCYLHVMRDGERPVAAMVLSLAEGGTGGMLDPVLELTSLATINRIRQRELARLAVRDPLTGALNRRALEERLETRLREAPTSSLLFALLDVDDFKAVNDGLGHLEADALLRRFTAHARSALRPQDDVARIGGDEFVFVLYGARWGPQARARLTEVASGGPLGEYGAGATFGVVEMPREAATYAEAYHLADERLYRGKRGGRGLVVGEDEPAGPPGR